MTRRVTSDIPAPVPATLETGDEASRCYALIMRISVAGAEIAILDPPRVGSDIRVTAKLDGEDVNLSGRVRWSSRDRVGVQLETPGVRETRAILAMNEAAACAAR